MFLGRTSNLLYRGAVAATPLRSGSINKFSPLRSRLGFSRSLFIQTEETPNPSSLKFLPGQNILPESLNATLSFRKGDGNNTSLLAKKLLRVDGVDSLMLGQDFISVNKTEDISWAQLKPDVFALLMDFFDSGKEAVVLDAEGEQMAESSPHKVDFSTMNEDEKEIVELILELLEEKIRPLVQEDGGDIFFEGFDYKTGIVTVKLAGSCEGCPSSTVTLKNGVENMLMHYIPEITRVDQAYEEEELNARTLNWTPSP